MKNKILFFILASSITATYGQIRFDKGYLTDNENHKVECFMRNYEWEKNPAECEYKLTENGEIKKGNITSVKEFGIYGASKYIRVTTNIDRSSTDLSDLRNPVWNEEQLFLKVIVQGKASLFNYTDEHSTKFFYSVKDSLIKQLIYKKYLTYSNKVTANIAFCQQLFNEVNCANTPISSISDMDYKQGDLERYFKNYNACAGTPVVDFDHKINKGKFNIRITPGMNYSSFSMFVFSHYMTYKKIDFDSQSSFRLGFEVEYLLPFYSNKFGVLLEPAFQNFNSNKEYGTKIATIKHNSIELLAGIRYYIFLNDHTKIFINGLMNSIVNRNFNSKIEIPNDLDSTLMPLTIKEKFNPAYGGGLNYKRLSAELRYYSNQKIMEDSYGWTSDYKKISLIVGYNLSGNRHNK